MSIGENACTYAALILHDDGIPITAEKISTLVKAANIKIESYWAPLFAKLLEKRSVDDLIAGVGSGGGGAVAVSSAPAADAAPAAAPAAEEKKVVLSRNQRKRATRIWVSASSTRVTNMRLHFLFQFSKFGFIRIRNRFEHLSHTLVRVISISCLVVACWVCSIINFVVSSTMLACFCCKLTRSNFSMLCLYVFFNAIA